MKILLIKQEILDEREKQLSDKAGAESFKLALFLTFILFCLGNFMGTGSIAVQTLLVPLFTSLVWYFIRAERLGVSYYNSIRLTAWGCFVFTAFITLMIMLGNYQFNHEVYGNNPLNSRYLMAWPITYILYLPFVFLANALLKLYGKYQKKRFEAQLDQLEDEV